MQFVAANINNLQLLNALIGTTNFTIAIIGKVTSTASVQSFVSVGTTANGIVLGVDINASSARDFNANGVVAVSDTTSLATTSWESWVLNSDASGNLTLMVNGVAHTPSPASATCAAPSAFLTLGAASAGSEALNGGLYDSAVWTVAQNNNAGIYQFHHKITNGAL
ncbi:MAG TPA: LamG-like jellyroll fold domain-containing protein [Candidatus Dormibacteraeota bacterium]